MGQHGGMTSIVEPVPDEQRGRATAFRRLHDEGIFVMPCAWDAGSARVLEQAGFACLGTTSGGVNWGRGRQDYVYSVERDVMLGEYEQIASAVALPVSGDLENGYGVEPADVADTIRAAIAAGMVGGSIEDQSIEPGPGLIPKTDAAERIAAARRAADELLADFTITARAESFFGAVADPFADAVERCNLYAEAGADCVFVPGPADLDTLKRLVDAVDAPVSLGVGSGGGALDLEQLRAIGIRRVSTGGALPRALYAQLRDAAREMLDKGTFSYTDHVMAEDDINTLMERPEAGR